MDTSLLKEKYLTGDSRKTVTVIEALIPCLLMGTFMFGWRALLVTFVSVFVSFACFLLYKKLSKDGDETGELIAIADGLLLAMMLPANVPLWIPCLGAFIASFLLRYVFWIGKVRPASPVVISKVILLFAFPKIMTAWPLTTLIETASDAVPKDELTTSTPQELLREAGEATDISRVVIGFVSGNIGEISVIAVLIGGLLLVWREVIDPRPTGIFLGALLAFFTIYYITSETRGDLINLSLIEISSGGAFFTAFFLMDDITAGKFRVKDKDFKIEMISAILLGGAAGVLRIAGPFPECMAPAVLIVSLIKYLLYNMHPAGRR